MSSFENLIGKDVNVSIEFLFINILIISFSFQHLFIPLYDEKLWIWVISLFMYFVLIINNVTRRNCIKVELQVVVFLLSFIFCNYILHVEKVGLGVILILLLFMLQLIAFRNIKLKIRELYSISACFFLFFSLYTFISLKNYFNTNTVGFVFLTCGIYSTLMVKTESFCGILLNVFVSIFVIIGILQYDCRTSLFAYCFYLLMKVLPIRLLYSSLKYKTLLFVFTIGSILFVFIYIMLFENRIDLQDYFSFSEKSVYSGRQMIWIEVLSLFENSPFWGIGSHVSLLSHDEFNVHNSMLHYLVVYGLPVYLMILFMLYRISSTFYKYVDDYIVKNGLAALFAYFLVAFTETNLIQEVFVSFLPIAIIYSRINNIKYDT